MNQKKSKGKNTHTTGKKNTRKRTSKQNKNTFFQRMLSSPAGKIICIAAIIIAIMMTVSLIERSIFEYRASQVTIEDLQACSTKEEYLDTVMPIYNRYCRRFGIKYPEILALQVFYEVGAGFPQTLSDVAIADNNLGGLKYAEGIPGATVGANCPPDEGGNYSHFETVGDYIYAQCWQIGQPLYEDVRKNQSSVEKFTRALCNLWIGGYHDTEPFGYSESLLEDYYMYKWN